MFVQVKKAAAAAKVALFRLRPLFRSKLPLRTKLALYKAFVRPHLTYATPAWYALANAPQRKIMQVPHTGNRESHPAGLTAQGATQLILHTLTPSFPSKSVLQIYLIPSLAPRPTPNDATIFMVAARDHGQRATALVPFPDPSRSERRKHGTLRHTNL